MIYRDFPIENHTRSSRGFILDLLLFYFFFYISRELTVLGFCNMSATYKMKRPSNRVGPRHELITIEYEINFDENADKITKLKKKKTAF